MPRHTTRCDRHFLAMRTEGLRLDRTAPISHAAPSGGTRESARSRLTDGVGACGAVCPAVRPSGRGRGRR